MAKTKTLTINDLKRMISEVKQEKPVSKLSESSFSNDRETQIKNLEAELDMLYQDPTTNADLIQDLELDLDDLYEKEANAKDELERSQFNSSYGDGW